MKVTLDLRQVKIVSVDKDGDTIKSITIEPVFATNTGSALALNGETTTSKGRKLEEFKLTVSGKTGRTAHTSEVPGVTVAPKIDDDETPASAAPGSKPPNRSNRQ